MSEHAHTGYENERRVLQALLITAGFMLVEVAGGLLSGSLALLADAGHMLTDALALGLAWAAFHLGRRPPDRLRSYGYHRFEVLAGWFNGIMLIGLSLWIVFEAVQRLMAPMPVQGGTMLGVAALGLIANLLVFRILHGGDTEHVNIRGALLHVIGDLLGSVAAIVAAVVILLTAWTPIDPLLSLLVAGLIVRSAWALVRHATHVLLEGAPEWLDVEEMHTALRRAIPELEDIHHVHAWSLSSGKPMLTLHARVRQGAAQGEVLAALKALLDREFRFPHSVVQLEAGDCPDERAGAGSVPGCDPRG